VTKREEVDEAIAWARNIQGPTVIEFKVEMEEAVYPMVPAGAALDQMIERPVKAKAKAKSKPAKAARKKHKK
jgi:acetolactate synthase-1/2/3 large subunit